MYRPGVLARILPLLCLFGALLTTPSAFAQDKKAEAAAKALQKKAMGDDYLATDFAKAKEKLDKAITTCGTDKCNANLRALLKRDLGTVLIVGGADKAAGQAAFVEALALDGTIQLDPDFKTKELEVAWEKAKKGGGATKPPKKEPSENSGKPAPAGDPEGDFSHTPVDAAQVRTQTPIYVEYTGNEEVVKVMARYKGFGMSEWKPLELKKMGQNGWGAMVPCMDVQIGKLQYFLQGFNAQNDQIASGGDRKNPYIVQVKQTVEEVPTLPGGQPPKQCADTGDCPPDFPGCKSTAKNQNQADDLLKSEGVDCDADTECKSKVCKAGKCTAPEETSSKDHWPRMWIGASFGLDFHFVPSATNVCKLNSEAAPMNDANYFCADPATGGGPYPGNDASGKASKAENDAILLDKSNKVEGGTALGQLRMMLTFDYAITKNFLLGGRFGAALLNSYPGGRPSGQFAPIHAEVRGTIVLGKEALAKAGIAPYIMLGAGASTFESKVEVEVKRPGSKIVDAYAVGGPGFVNLGGGVRYQLKASEKVFVALIGGLKFGIAMGNNVMPHLGPELGMQVGF
ncbi:MAG: hypothetical protein U0174_12255 [Polyangiaceae bacterium]